MKYLKKIKLIILFFILPIFIGIIFYNFQLVSYIIKVSFCHFELLINRKPIKKLLQDKNTPQKLKNYFLLVKEIKEYSIKYINLKPTSNYEDFVDIKRDYLVYVISACSAFSLDIYTWNFPMIGKFPYKGFFNKKDAMEELNKLKSEGYDTYIRKVDAYSTLGLLPDPIISTMLDYDEYNLANIIIHESTHATIFIKDNVDFNENLANFVGNQGAISFLSYKYGENSIQVKRAKSIQKDTLLFGKFINELYTKLKKLYSKKITIYEKIKFFKFEKQEFIKLKTKFQTEIYKNFDKLEWNNAMISSYITYYKDLSEIEKIYQNNNKNLFNMIKNLKKDGAVKLRY